MQEFNAVNIHIVQLAPDMTNVDLPARITGDIRSWENYQAVRDYFLNHAVEDDTLYGFIHHSFQKNTGFDVSDLHAWVDSHPGYTAYNIYPHLKESACFLNTFEQYESACAGVIEAANSFFLLIGLELDVSTWVVPGNATTDMHHIVATPAFWRTWFDLTEKIYNIADEKNSPLGKILAGPEQGQLLWTNLANGMVSVVLMLDQDVKVVQAAIEEMPLARETDGTPLDNFLLLDNLKRAYLATDESRHLQHFYTIRNNMFVDSELSLSDQTVRTPDIAVREDGAWPQDIFYATTSHVPLIIEFPEQIRPFYLGQQQSDGRLNMRDYAPDWEAHYRSVAGMTALFAIRHYIRQYHPTIERVGICMYRKFVSAERITGIEAKENWMMDVVSDKDMKKRSFISMLHPGDNPFLIGKPCGFNVGNQAAGYLRHYAYAHHAEDLLRMTAIALELGVFDKDDVNQFLEEKEFFIGGLEIGVFAAAFWLNAIDQIERVIYACVTQHPNHREGYQRRSWAFCAERLGSYLLIRYLRRHYPDYQRFYGQLNLLVKGDQTEYTYGGLTEEA